MLINEARLGVSLSDMYPYGPSLNAQLVVPTTHGYATCAHIRAHTQACIREPPCLKVSIEIAGHAHTCDVTVCVGVSRTTAAASHTSQVYPICPVKPNAAEEREV